MFRRMRNFEARLIRAYENPPASGTTTTSDPGGKGGAGGSSNPPPAPDLAKENADLKAELAKLRAGSAPKTPDDPDLIEKARRQRETEEKDNARTKRLEHSISFNMKLPEFLKQNESLLTKDIGDIVKAAEKENYSDAVEKTDAIKSGVVQSFFSVQANVDLLTGGQKALLDDYLKLTKTGKQEKASQIYDMLFEPAFEMLKRTKRAEALNKGYAPEGDLDAAYKNKLMSGSRKHYGLGEKK